MRIDTFVFRLVTTWIVASMFIGLPLIVIDSIIIGATDSDGFFLKNFENSSVRMY